MIGYYTEDEYIQFLYEHYCKNDYERSELYKWIKKDGIVNVSRSMKTLLSQRLSDKLKSPPLPVSNKPMERIKVYIMYEFDKANPYFHMCNSIDDIKRFITTGNLDLYCDTRNLVNIEK